MMLISLLTLQLQPHQLDEPGEVRSRSMGLDIGARGYRPINAGRGGSSPIAKSIGYAAIPHPTRCFSLRSEMRKRRTYRTYDTRQRGNLSKMAIRYPAIRSLILVPGCERS